MASRGLATLAVRAERASQNALAAAEYLSARPEVASVAYPGLASHPDHKIAREQFPGLFGSMVSFHLAGGRAAAETFIRVARNIAFCPSLGDVATTLSHPQSTSHRSLTQEQQQALGIDGGVIRLSVGIESREHVLESLAEGLAGL
jgi:cystathionine beta-lyase/cystathionine gamma-synthase